MNHCESGMYGRVRTFVPGPELSPHDRWTEVELFEEGELFDLVKIPVSDLDFVADEGWQDRDPYASPPLVAGVDPRIELLSSVRLKKKEVGGWLRNSVCEAGMEGTIVELYRNETGERYAATVEIFKDGETFSLIEVLLSDLEWRA